MIREISNTNNNIYPTGLVPLAINWSQGFDVFDEDKAVIEFREYRAELAEKVIVMRNVEDPTLGVIIRPSDSSRYFEGGRKKAKRNIRKRFGKNYSMAGVFVTLTYDHERFKRWGAWERVNKDITRLKHSILMRYNRAGRKAPTYILVIEEQKKTGYPHVHIFYPGLKYLIDKELLQSYWNVGRARVEYADNVNIGGYVCKYVSKMAGWSEEALAFMWKKKRRMYSYSRCYRLPLEEKKPGEWVFIASSTGRRLTNHIDYLMTWFDEILNLDKLILSKN